MSLCGTKFADMLYRQYTHIVGKYEIYIYEVYTREETRTLCEFILPVPQRLEMNCIFSDNANILYRVMSKASKQLSNCLKRKETSVVLIIFDYVLCEVRAYI